MNAQPQLQRTPADPAPYLCAVDELVYLTGRPPVGDLIGFFRTMAVGGAARPKDELVEEWRQANDRVCMLERTDAARRTIRS